MNPADSLRNREVSADKHAFRAQFVHLPERLLPGILLNISTRHCIAGLRKMRCYRASDSLGSTGDSKNFHLIPPEDLNS
jgi:hypothetical protein